MVMKKDGRKRDIKSKLVAAVCMLLVSCIMMVSSTYAWFTLSTAPEVKGISTSVGSNGNLEIALSPADGDGTKVGDYAIGANVNDWVAKNLTWGNLLDLSDESYGLQNWVLSPSQLLMSGTEGNYKLGAVPLAIPEYGSDGRVTALNKTDVSFGGDGKYGVRPVGSASGLSAQAAQLKASLADIINYANKATEAASKSLNENGQAMASIMVQHAKAGEGDSNNYGAFVADLQKLTGALDASVDNLKEAVRSALIVAACAKNYESETAFENAVGAIKTANIDTLIGEAGAEASAAYTAISAVATAVSEAQQAANGLSADSASWTQVSGVVLKLMNTTGVTISGKSIGEIKDNMNDMNFLLGLATNCRIELGEGSGVYYDIAKIAGNITASTTAHVDAGDLGSVDLPNVIITTTFSGTAQLTALHTTMKGVQAPTVEGATAVIDTFYGYVIDFMFRTNAADSNLLLQTEGAQRVYDDSTNTATQGAGSTFTFTTTNANHVATLKSMILALRVVFFEPGNGNNVLGVAKATSVTATEEGGTYTITGYLTLCTYSVTDTGLVEVGNAKVDAEGKQDAVLTALGQNVATAVSAMVYLDGSNLTNADMLTSGEVEGKLNLQFASDANLVPMNNNDLYQGETQNP